MSLRTSARLLSLFAASTLAFPLLTGCGMGHIDTSMPSAAFHGKVFGGHQPITQATISVWQAGNTAYGTAASSTPLATVQSDDNGNFTFPPASYLCPAMDPDSGLDTTTQIYITAAGGFAAPTYSNPNILLAAGLGNCSSAQQQFVVINEVTTAATAYALAQFADPDRSSGGSNGFGSSAGDASYFALSNSHTIPMLVDLASGIALPSGNGVTREDARLNSIADILASCVNDSSTFTHCNELFTDTATSSPANVQPVNTLQAAIAMALQPTQNVDDLFNIYSGISAPFIGLSTEPTDLLLSIAYTSPDFGLSINSAYPGGSSSSIDIAADGRVFFPSNASGKTGIGVFDPSLAGFGSLQIANLLTLPQYVGVDPILGNIFATDLGSGNLAGVTSNYLQTINNPIDSDSASSAALSLPSNAPVVSETTTSGTTNLTLTLPGIFTQVLTTLNAPATGIADYAGNFFAMTSAVTGPCMLEEIDTTDGTTYTDQVDLQTSFTCNSGGIFAIFNTGFGIASTPNETCVSTFDCEVDPNLSTPKGIAYDGVNNIWVANSGNASLYFSGAFSGVSGIFAFSHPDTLFKPYGIAVDGSGNVWLSNAGCVTATTTACNPGAFTLTEFIGAGAPTITPLGAASLGGNFAGTEPMASRHNAVLSNTHSSHLSVPTNIPAPWGLGNASH